MPTRRRNAPHVRFASPGGREAKLAGLFLLGLALFLPPFLTIFSQPIMVWGIPLFYLYLFAAWALLIFLLARTLRRGPDAGSE